MQGSEMVKGRYEGKSSSLIQLVTVPGGSVDKQSAYPPQTSHNLIQMTCQIQILRVLVDFT